MLSTSFWRLLAGTSALWLSVSAAGCQGNSEKTAGASADEASAGSGAGAAEDECRSGQTRCHGELGYQRCTPDGVWGTSQSCGGYSENGTSSYCVMLDYDGEPWAACTDPACFWWKQSGLDPEGQAGVCVGPDKLRPCAASILAPPQQCAGLCRRVAELDGRVLGYCDSSCVDGERECLGGSLYRECAGGRWSTQAASCAGGAACQPLASGPISDIKCGGDCEEGTARCSEDGTSIESCTEASEWQRASPCALGRCVQSGAQAQCQTECKPGERACAFDGAPSELSCSDQGLWSEAAPCGEGAPCRIGTAAALGCMKCVGPLMPGGNAWGVADSHCAAAGVELCGADNEYLSAEPCLDGQQCVELGRGAASLAYCK